MISKGNVHNNGVKLAEYMGTGKKGESAEVWQLRGFLADNIKDAFRDVEIMADGTKCQQPLFHVQVRNRDGETLTRQQWEYAADRIERILGLTGQPRAIAFHTYEDTGFEHMHVAWSRIDEATLKVVPLPFFKDRLKKISRELEAYFEFQAVSNHRPDPIKFAPKKAEEEQSRRLGLDIHEVRNTIRHCYDHSDSGRSFQAALEHEGLRLARGDRRDFLVVDHAGGLHALGKRILDVSASKIRARLSDLDRNLPTLQEIRVFLDDMKIERRGNKQAPWQEEQRDRDTVRDHIHWEDQVARAAIVKEDKERQFVEPKQSRKNSKSGNRERNRWPITPPQSEHKGAHVFAEAEKDLTHDFRPDKLKGKAAEAWQAWTNVIPKEHLKEFRDLREKQKPFSVAPDPKAFAAELDKKGISFAVASKTEAEESQRKHRFANAVGNYAVRFTEGEILIVAEPPFDYRRDGQIHRPSRLHKIDQSVAEKFVNALGGHGTLKNIEVTLATSDERKQKRAAEWEALRLQNATGERKGRRKHLGTEELGNARTSAEAIPAKKAAGTTARAASKALDATRKPLNTAARATGSVLSGVGKGLDIIGGIVESLAAPTLTPEQLSQAYKAKAAREKDADEKIDFSRYEALRAEHIEVQNGQQARDREREAGGRER